MLPAEHHKVLANIRKAEARTKRRRLAAEEQDDSESEGEAPKTKSQRLELFSQRAGPSLSSCFWLHVLLPSHLPLSSIEDILAESDSDMSEDGGRAGNAQKKAGKTQKGRAWLKEGEEDDPLNFLDPKVSQRVLGKLLLFTWKAIKKTKQLHSVELKAVKLIHEAFGVSQPPIHP